MKSDKSLLLEWFYRKTFPSGILEFDSLLYTASQEALKKSAIDAEAYTQKNITRIWNEFLKSLDWDLQEGRSQIFEVKNIYERKITWLPSNINNLRTKKEKHKIIKLGSRPNILNLIDMLNDREYEALGCVACELIGASNVHLTPKGNERGIDFFATLHLDSRCHVFSDINRSFRIVGQSKKYDSKVELKELQRLNDTLNEVKYLTPEMQKLIPSWFLVKSGPIFGWIIAHNGVQAGGLTYAKNHGIIISDSYDLAEIVALSRTLDYSASPTKRADLIKSKILSYLEM